MTANFSKRHTTIALCLLFVFTGLVDNFLMSNGYENLAILVFVAGYGFVILGGWAIWLRPLNLTGGSEENTLIWTTDEDDVSEESIDDNSSHQ